MKEIKMTDHEKLLFIKKSLEVQLSLPSTTFTEIGGMAIVSDFMKAHEYVGELINNCLGSSLFDEAKDDDFKNRS